MTSSVVKMSKSCHLEKSNYDNEVYYVDSSLSENIEQPIATEECACAHILMPLLTYMKFFGLDHTFCRPAFRPFFKFYSVVILFLQIASLIAMVIQFDPPNEGLKTSTTLKITAIIFLGVGAASTIMLYFFQDKVLLVCNAIVRALPQGTELPEHNSLKRISRILVALTIALSSVDVFSYFATQVGFVKMPPMHLFIAGFPFWLIDMVVVWLTQSSTMMAASVLCVFCQAIRKSLIRIGDDMRKNSDGDIFDYQKQYQALADAASLLERGYSLFILFIYALSVPMVSFILFTILRGDDIDLLGAAVLLFWALGMIFILFFVSIPPILLFEQGNELVKSCYQMYNIHVDSEKNTMLFQQSVQFLASQITATPLSMTAGNFFILSRAMLLVLFSQILTYFIIILQSGPSR